MAPLGFHIDLWALGVTLFQLTTGKLPFDNITDIPDASKPAKDVLDELAEDRRAGFSTHFSKILARSMTKKRTERYDAAEIMLEDLHQCLVARGESMYSVFISYRVFSEAKMAHLLFKVLSNSQTANGHRVTVYLDHKRLEDGEPWEKGFCEGLLNSIMFVPLVSNRGVTDIIGKLEGGDADRADNVLKELQLAVALMEVDEKRKAGGYTAEEDPKGNGKLKGILPLLVNDQANKGEEGYPCMKQFDFSKLNFVDQVSSATTTAVVGFLKDNQVPVPEAAPTRTVKATMNTIMSTQGIQVLVVISFRVSLSLCVLLSLVYRFLSRSLSSCFYSAATATNVMKSSLPSSHRWLPTTPSSLSLSSRPSLSKLTPKRRSRSQCSWPS